MSGRHRTFPDSAKIALLAAVFLACPLVAAEAQEAAPTGIDTSVEANRVELATVGTYAYFRPWARLQLREPSYVAVFEIEPGVGATMIYPHDPWPQKLHMAGVHTIDLTGPQVRTARRLMSNHLGFAFVHRPTVVPRNHLVAVASDRPLWLDGLLSGRVFEYRHGFAGPERVTRALLANVVRDTRPTAWSSAVTSYWKFRDPTLLTLGAGVPWFGGSLQFLGSFRGFGFGTPGSLRSLRASLPCDLHDHLRGRCSGRLVDTDLQADRRTVRADDETSSEDARPQLPEDLRALIRKLGDATTRLERDERGTLRTLELLGEAVHGRRGGVGGIRARTLHRGLSPDRARGVFTPRPTGDHRAGQGGSWIGGRSLDRSRGSLAPPGPGDREHGVSRPSRPSVDPATSSDDRGEDLSSGDDDGGG